MLHLPSQLPDYDALRRGEFGRQALRSQEDRLEIENGHRVTKEFWLFLYDYFEHIVGHELARNTTKSIYCDTDDLDLLSAARTFRDRPAGRTTHGEKFPDQFGIKYTHEELQRLANKILADLFPDQIFRNAMPRVRSEVEIEHKHERNVKAYGFYDLPMPVRYEITRLIDLDKAEGMTFNPLFASYVPRRTGEIYIDPWKDVENCILPASNPVAKNQTQVCFEVALDECHEKMADLGMDIKQLFQLTHQEWSGLGRARDESWIFEHEVKLKSCGENVTDGMIVWAYALFIMHIYGLAEPFRQSHKVVPIRPVGSKGARGFKSLIENHPKWRRFRDQRIYRLAA